MQHLFKEYFQVLVEITYDLMVCYIFTIVFNIATNYTHIFLNYVNSCQVQVMYSVQVEKDNITLTYKKI